MEYINPNDKIIREHIEEEAIEHDHEIEKLRDILRERYPTPESAVDDYRAKELSDAELAIRFAPDEIEFIMEMIQRRKKDESSSRNNFL